MLRIGLLTAGLMQASCSHQEIYQAIQENRELECRELSPGQYENCMEQVAGDYEEYRQARDEVLDAE